MLVEEDPKMKLLLPENEWDAVNLIKFDRIMPRNRREDLSVIILDNCEEKPAVLEVIPNIFKNKKPISFAAESLVLIEELLAELEVRSNEEIMEAIRQSRIDKKEGNLRKFNDIVAELGLE